VEVVAPLVIDSPSHEDHESIRLTRGRSQQNEDLVPDARTREHSQQSENLVPPDAPVTEPAQVEFTQVCHSMFYIMFTRLFNA